MRDYKFGEFLCERRKALSFSQFQLGRLVGVSDKAVSKWENGTAKPKSSLLIKLAEVLDISIDELFNCKLTQKKSRSEQKVEQKTDQKVWKKAMARMEELYGENAPLQVTNRLNKERQRLENCFMLDIYNLIGEIASASEKNNYETACMGTMGGSLLAYLLGASSINPLKPHYLCPDCKKTYFVKNVGSAWDLPEKVCDCGCQMERLGQEIPFETTHNELKFQYAVCTVANDMINEAIDIVKALSDDMRIVCVLPNADSDNKYNPYRFFFVFDKEPGFETIEYDEEKIGKLQLNYCLTVQTSQLLSTLHQLSCECKIKLKDIFPTKEILGSFSNAMTDGIKEFESEFMKNMLLKASPKSFYELSKISGLAHGTGTWNENGENLIQQGEKLCNLIAFREDVFMYVEGAMAEIGIYDGQEFAYTVMNDTRRGMYSVRGMDKETENALKQLSLPKWFIPSVSQICYLIPKPHVLYYVKFAIYLMWIKQNYPEMFGKAN